VNIVERCVHAPGYCIATLCSEDPKGFIDTGLTPAVVDPRVYVSVRWIEEIAGKLGFVAGSELEDAKREVKDLETRLREDDKLLAAAEYTMTGMKSRKKKAAA